MKMQSFLIRKLIEEVDKNIPIEYIRKKLYLIANIANYIERAIASQPPPSSNSLINKFKNRYTENDEHEKDLWISFYIENKLVYDNIEKNIRSFDYKINLPKYKKLPRYIELEDGYSINFTFDHISEYTKDQEFYKTAISF